VSLRLVPAIVLAAIGATTVEAQAPSAPNSHAMASLGPDGGILLFGGAAGGAPRLVDTLWTRTGTAWRPLSDAGPRSRNLPGMAYDSRRGVVVLYGGAGIGSGTRFGDTWEWDRRRWEEKNVRTPGPGAALVRGHGVRRRAPARHPLRRRSHCAPVRLVRRYLGVGWCSLGAAVNVVIPANYWTALLAVNLSCVRNSNGLGRQVSSRRPYIGSTQLHLSASSAFRR